MVPLVLAPLVLALLVLAPLVLALLVLAPLVLALLVLAPLVLASCPGGSAGGAAWLAVAAVAGLFTGCASATTPQAGSIPAAGKATQPGRGQGGTAPASPAGSGTAVPGLGGLALCQASSLHVTVNTSQTGVAMGSRYYPVDFTNTASSPCGLYGYPGISFVTPR